MKITHLKTQPHLPWIYMLKMELHHFNLTLTHCGLVMPYGDKELAQLERRVLRILPAASWLPIPLSHIGSQVKRRQSQSYKFKEFAKISNFWILKETLHATQLLKLLDKMCKYEMDPMSIVEDTERTRFCPQTDRRTSLKNMISAAMKQAAPHTCFFFLVFFI